MSFLGSLATNIVAAWEAVGSAAIILWGIERLFPKGRVTVDSQLRAVTYWLFTGAGTGLAITIYAHVAAMLQPRPLFVVPLNDWFASPWFHWSLYVIAPAVGVILYDFFDYWMHRAQHRWFWKFHSIHHSIEELSGINSYFHWSEQFFRIVFIIIPAAYIVGIDGIKTTAVAELLVRLQGYYLHSPTRFHVGPLLRKVIADNRFHRIHHSIHDHHFDKSFGAGTTLWDHLFGTAYFPTADEWPDTGMIDQREAATLHDFLWSPFKIERRIRRSQEAETTY